MMKLHVFRSSQVALLAGVVLVSKLDVVLSNDPVETVPTGWQTLSQREEIRPKFVYEPGGGINNQPRFCIIADPRNGLAGWWQTSMTVTGGKKYRFEIDRRCTNVKSPRRTGVVRILWRDKIDNP